MNCIDQKPLIIMQIKSAILKLEDKILDTERLLARQRESLEGWKEHLKWLSPAESIDQKVKVSEIVDYLKSTGRISKTEAESDVEFAARIEKFGIEGR